MKRYFAIIISMLLFSLTLSIVFNANANTDTCFYKDPDANVSFNVPTGWKQKDFSKDREFIDVKFVPIEEDGCVIIYGSTDLWEQIPSSEKDGYTRSDFNNSAFTASDIASICNTTADKISMITYDGNVQYFKAESDYASTDIGIDITAKMTQLVYFDNGWVYMFWFGGTATQDRYPDFENLIKSVQYPSVSNLTKVDSTNNITSDNNITPEPKNTNNDYYGNLSIIALAISLSLVIAIVVAVVITFKKNTTSANKFNYILDHNSSSQKSLDETKQGNYCKNCGQLLPSDSIFCHNCGVRIEKEI